MSTKTVVADPQTLPPALLSAKNAARFCGMSIATWRRKISAGLIGPRPVTIGSCQRFRRLELELWVAASCPPRNAWTWPPIEESAR